MRAIVLSLRLRGRFPKGGGGCLRRWLGGGIVILRNYPRGSCLRGYLSLVYSSRG